MPTVKELSDMEIDEISLVDRPANEHAKVVITKRDSEEEIVPEEIYNEDGDILDVDDVNEGDVVFDEDGQAFVVVEDEFEDELETVGKSEYEEIEKGKVPTGFKAGQASGFLSNSRSAINDAAKKQGVPKSARKQGIKDIVDDPVKAADKANRKAGGWTNAKYQTGKFVTQRPGASAAILGGTAATAGAGGAYALKKSFADELREELSKSLTDIERDEVVAKAFSQVEQMQASLAEAEEIAKSERDLRLVREYEEVAKSYNLPVDPEDLAPVLMAIAETLPYEYGEVIHKALSAAGEILFEEVGFQGTADNNDVLTAVDSYIDENVSKADISKAEAVTAVFTDNPDAYDEYMATRY